MGLGKFLIQSVTRTVKCDVCGTIIVDGRFRYGDGGALSSFYGIGGPTNNNDYGRGLGFFENIFNSGRTLCSACQRLEHFQDPKPDKQQLGALKEVLDKTKQEMDQSTKELTELAKYELELKRQEIELKRQELEAMKKIGANPNANSFIGSPPAAPPPVAGVAGSPQPARKSAFCTNCGCALKPNARFCSQCGAGAK